MKINEIRVLARASMNYQVGEYEITATDIQSEEEVSQLEKQCIAEATKVVKALGTVCSTTQPAAKPQVQVQRQTYNKQYQKPIQQGYSQPMQTRGQYQPKMISQAQINFLHGLGYSGQTENLTSKQAIELIQSLKAQQQMGYNHQPQPEYDDDNGFNDFNPNDYQ